MKQISLRLPEEMLDQLDQMRGDVPRDRWLRKQLQAVIDGSTAKREVDPRLRPDPRAKLDPRKHAFNVTSSEFTPPVKP